MIFFFIPFLLNSCPIAGRAYRTVNAPVKVNPDPPPPPPRDMWGFGGDLLPYWQLFESQVGGGFARFCGSCPQECGALVGDSFEYPRWRPFFLQRSLGNPRWRPLFLHQVLASRSLGILLHVQSKMATESTLTWYVFKSFLLSFK